MFGRTYHLFNAFGIPIRVDVSWIFIAILITWSFTAEFANWVPGLTAGSYWAMGAAAALGMFTSIVLHELGHALTARRFGVEMESITLFIFGGVAEMRSEPPSAKAEFWVAIAGPIVSVVLAAAFSFAAISFGLEVLTAEVPRGEQTVRTLRFVIEGEPAIRAAIAVVGLLGMVNTMLVVFNMIPAFPLDGGRVLRSILWAVRGDLKKATQTTAAIGSGFGLLLIILGLFRIVGGDTFGGLWSILIGWFLRQAATGSYQHMLLRRSLEGEPVHRFMQRQVVTVEPDLPIADFVENVVYRFHHKMYPVARNGELVGCVSTRRVAQLDRDRWRTQTVADIMDPCDTSNTVSPNADAMAAMARMNRARASRLIVTDNGRIEGIITLKDLMAFMALKVELEQG